MRKLIFVPIILFFLFGFNNNYNQEEKLIYGTWNFYKTFSSDYSEEIDSIVTEKTLSDEEFKYLKSINSETEKKVNIICCTNKHLTDIEYTFFPNKNFLILDKKSKKTLKGTWKLIEDNHNKYIELDYNEIDYARHFTLEKNLDRYKKMNIDVNEMKKVPFHLEKITKDTIYSNRYLSDLKNYKYEYLIDLYVKIK